MQTRNLIGLIIVILFFSTIAWFMLGPQENNLLFFGVGFGFVIIFFILIASVSILIHKKSQEALNRFTIDYGLKPEMNVEASIRTSIENIVQISGAIIDNIYTRPVYNGQLTFFDLSYWTQRHKGNDRYQERIIAFPCSFKFNQRFSIGKRTSKRGAFIEEFVARFLGLTVVPTNHVDFDMFYSLLVPDENMDIRSYVNISREIYPILEKYLGKIKRYPVGPTMYSCIISFINQMGFIRFNPQNLNVESFYNLANELVMIKKIYGS